MVNAFELFVRALIFFDYKINFHEKGDGPKSNYEHIY